VPLDPAAIWTYLSSGCLLLVVFFAFRPLLILSLAAAITAFAATYLSPVTQVNLFTLTALWGFVALCWLGYFRSGARLDHEHGILITPTKAQHAVARFGSAYYLVTTEVPLPEGTRVRPVRWRGRAVLVTPLTGSAGTGSPGSG